MGTALYRQYRSTSFDEVIGQDHITSTLKNSLKSGSIGHAYLLTGPRGVGKTSIARILAYAVNGLSYEEGGNHLDIIEIDAASNRRIDEIRSLRERVHMAPTSAKYKVYIIDEVHMLTREAFNALLKTLEEPPAHVIFILATTEIHKLPDTIVSRCITFTFRPIDDEALVGHLKHIAKAEKLQISDDALALLAVHGDGSFRDSISLLDQIKNISDKKIERSDIELSLGLAPENVISQIIASVASGNPQSLEANLQQAYQHGASEINLAKQVAAQVRHELVQGKPSFASSGATALLKELLDVPGSAKPRAALELCLLSLLFKTEPLAAQSIAAPTPIAVAKAKQPEVVKVVTTPEPVVAVEIEAASDVPKADEELSDPFAEAVDEPTEPEQSLESIIEEVEPKPIATVQVDGDLWDAILNELKKKNNTLYGIARMGVANHTEDALHITFRFSFHYKQLNDAKNKAIIIGIKDDLGHKSVGFEVSLNKDTAKGSATATGSKKSADPALSSITDIFGAGEVLES